GPLLLAGRADHLADDVGAEGSVGTADRQGLAVPVVGQAGGNVTAGNQLRLGHGAGDRHRAFAADVLLREDGVVVDVDVAGTAAVGRKPRRQVRPAAARAHADAAAGPRPRGRGAGAMGVVFAVDRAEL